MIGLAFMLASWCCFGIVLHFAVLWLQAHP